MEEKNNHARWSDGRYVFLRWVLGIFIILSVFWLGIKVGEFKAAFDYGYGPLGYGSMMGGYYPGYGYGMMGRGWYDGGSYGYPTPGPGMMYGYYQNAASGAAASSSKSK